MRRRLWALRHNQLAANITAFFGARVLQQLMPLLALPFLARVLGPTEWGVLAFAQVFAMYGVILVQFGFDLSATREIARHRHDRERISGIAGSVLGCQLILVLVVVGGALVAQTALPIFVERPALLWAATALALAEGVVPIWFFNGIERMPLFVTVGTINKMIATALVFSLVGSIDDAWRVPAIYASSALATATFGHVMAFRHLRPRLPRPVAVLRMLEAGFGMFVLRLGNALKDAGGPMILGLLAGPQQIAFYVASEKLTRPGAWLAQPINHALLPRLSALTSSRPSEARQMARLALSLMVGAGLTLGAGVMALGPWLVTLVFGPGFEAAGDVVRVLALLIPLLVVNESLSAQWLIPRRLDRPLACITGGAVALTAVLALMLVPAHGAFGMAWTAVLVEIAVLAALTATLLHHDRSALGPVTS